MWPTPTALPLPPFPAVMLVSLNIYGSARVKIANEQGDYGPGHFSSHSRWGAAQGTGTGMGMGTGTAWGRLPQCTVASGSPGALRGISVAVKALVRLYNREQAVSLSWVL